MKTIQAAIFDIGERKKEIFLSQYLPNLKPFPNAKKLIQALIDSGIRIGVATSAKASELKQFLKIIGIEDLVEICTSADEVESSKPHPDVIHVALSKLKLLPDQVLMVGDTPYDIKAAQKAGVKTIAFRCGGHWTDKDLSEAIAIYDSPSDLLSTLKNSPFFQNDRNYSQADILENVSKPNEDKMENVERDKPAA